MLVGEIGIDRDLYQYRLMYWEVLLIIWGYFRRSHPMYDAARLVAHQVHYCMGVPKGTTVKLPHELMTFSWERHRAEVSQEDIDQLQAEMDAWNKQHTETPKPGDELED